MYVEHTNQVVQASFVQFVVTFFGPLSPEFAAYPVNCLRHVAQTLLCVEPIHNLDRTGEVFTREVPDPMRPVTQHYPTFCLIEPTPGGLPKHPLGERRIIGGACGGALDGCRVGNGAFIPGRPPLLVPAFRAPYRAEFHLPRFCRAVGLLALASQKLALPHRDAGAVDSEIEC